MEPEQLREEVKCVSIALTTPFKENEELDLEGLRHNVSFFLDVASKYNQKLTFMVAGTVGEFYNLNDEEAKQIISTVADAAKGKATVLATAGRPSTKATLEICEWAQDSGVDGVVIVLPYYVTPNEESVYNHMKAITEGLTVGVLLYDNTDATKIHVNPALIARMAEDLPSFVGIKENSTDALFWYSLKPLQGRLSIFPGKGEIPYASFVHMGAPGFTTAIGNFCPEITFEVFAAGQKKDYEGIWNVVKRIAPYSRFVAKVAAKRTPASALGKKFTTNFTYYAVIKAAAELRGLAEGNLRSPLERLTEGEKEELKDVLVQMNLL